MHSMPLDLPPPMRELLALQSGVIARQQALGFGLDRDDVRNLVRYGRWQCLQRGVYAAFSGRPLRSAELWAVVLRAGPGATLSHYTAAELVGLAARPRGLIHVTVPAKLTPDGINGAVVHRSRRIEAARHPAQFPPRTRVEETVLDLTQVSATLDQAFDWLCRAVSGRLTTADRLSEALGERRRVRWRQDLLGGLTDIAGGILSALERRYVRGVERAHGLPAARRQARTGTDGRSRYLDNLYELAQVAVELDGRIAHPPEQRWADARRDNEHARAGILTVHYNWADVTTRPCEVAAQIAELLALRGAPVRLRRCGPACTVGDQGSPGRT
jgi:hypothetical protein